VAIPTPENGVVRPPAATYRIRVAGVLGEEWTDHTQGMAVSVRRSESGGAVTEFVGELVDEAARHVSPDRHDAS
jgi:hypothetical protein